MWKVVNEMSATISPLEQVLKDRGHNMDSFLNPDLSQLHDPMLMKDMSKGVNRTLQSINNEEKIRIFGDYDSDGINSAFTMVSLLKEAGAIVDYDIPDRKDGYGMNNQMIDQAYKDGITLIITCDNGIACIEQTEHAKSLGIDVIITDHHEPQDQIPDCIVINPKRKDCPYPFKELAGCAVAWKFCQAVLQSSSHPQGWLKALDVIESVAIGTVSDMMDLVDENRVIVTIGLQRLNNTKIIGVQELLKAMKLKDKEIDSGTIGFSIGPALNATGRLVSAKEAVDMMLEKSRLKALRSAKYLSDLNAERKEWTEKYTNKILKGLEGTNDKVIVYTQPDIPEGIVGIIASRLMNKLNRPILLMTLDESGTFYKGSGRSIPEYNLFENIMKHKHLFKAAGGHEAACGFSIDVENVEKLHDALNQETTLTDNDLMPKVMIDYDIDPHHITMKFAEELNKLQPFGKGNPKPLFQMTNAMVCKDMFLGKNKNTLKLVCLVGGHEFECIGFNMTEKYAEIADSFNGEQVWLDIAFYPGINEWNGRRSLQLELKDIRASHKE